MKNIVLLILLAFSLNSCKEKEVELIPEYILAGDIPQIGKQWRIVENYTGNVNNAEAPCHANDKAVFSIETDAPNYYAYRYIDACKEPNDGIKNIYTIFFTDSKTMYLVEFGKVDSEPILKFEVIKLTANEFYIIANKGKENEVRWRFVPLELEEENN